MTVSDLAQALSQLVSQGHGDARVMCDGDEVSGFVVREQTPAAAWIRGWRNVTPPVEVELLTDVPF